MNDVIVNAKTGPVVVDIYSGCGGSSEGFRQAGLAPKAACDKWDPAVRTHRRNHPDTRMFCGDISNPELSNLELFVAMRTVCMSVQAFYRGF